MTKKTMLKLKLVRISFTTAFVKKKRLGYLLDGYGYSAELLSVAFILNLNMNLPYVVAGIAACRSLTISLVWLQVTHNKYNERRFPG